MRYAQIRSLDVANGPGIRVTVFVTGCTHACPNCFNKLYQDPAYGQVWTEETTRSLKHALGNPCVKGLTLLGGEPMQNLELIEVLQALREENPSLNIWIYSGYTYEQICAHPRRKCLLSLCDVLVDGLYVEGLRNLKLPFRGSANQRILLISESLRRGEPIWVEGYGKEFYQPDPRFLAFDCSDLPPRTQSASTPSIV